MSGMVFVYACSTSYSRLHIVITCLRGPARKRNTEKLKEQSSSVTVSSIIVRPGNNLGVRIPAQYLALVSYIQAGK